MKPFNNFNDSYSHHFITIVTFNRQNFFGEIHNNKMILSKIGIIAQLIWDNIHMGRDYLMKDEFIIMPNHIHGILSIKKSMLYNIEKKCYLFDTSGHKNKVKNILNAYKSTVTKYTNRLDLEFRWQPNFHQTYINSNKELEIKRNYILKNITNWSKKNDQSFPNIFD